MAVAVTCARLLWRLQEARQPIVRVSIVRSDGKRLTDDRCDNNQIQAVVGHREPSVAGSKRAGLTVVDGDEVLCSVPPTSVPGLENHLAKPLVFQGSVLFIYLDVLD